MKTTARLSLMIAFSLFAFVACHKEHQAVTKVIAVTLSTNETYTYTIPATGDADDKMEITQPALHALSNTLAFTDNKNPSAFQYTPVKDYTGTDEVRVSTIEDHHGNNMGPGGGNCQGHHHHDEGTTYIFKISIGGRNSPE